MPVKRRLAKARAELGQGERLFLAGAPNGRWRNTKVQHRATAISNR